MTIDLRLGRWQDVLADVECDALITDPPYGSVVHDGHNRVLRYNPATKKQELMPDGASRHELPYQHWTPEDAVEFCERWSPRVTGWMVILNSHDLYYPMREALEGAGRYVFHPIPCIVRGMSVRLCGDGPSSWTVWATVSRPRSSEFSGWGTLPGAYWGSRADRSNAASRKMPGGKTMWMMSALVRDYSRPGDIVCDPCAGQATTLLAASGMGRHAIGAEVDPDTHAKAMERIGRGVQQELFA